jgi:hypothetical protein
MLGSLRMSCIYAYLEMSEKVFDQAQGLCHRDSFDQEALEQAIKDVVKRKLGDDHVPLADSTCCMT